jgi:excisionase family DNA binding protein
VTDARDWMLTTADIADALGVSRFTVRRLIVLGFLPCARQYRVGNRTTYRVSLSELMEFARAHNPDDVQRIADSVRERMAS